MSSNSSDCKSNSESTAKASKTTAKASKATAKATKSETVGTTTTAPGTKRTAAGPSRPKSSSSKSKSSNGEQLNREMERQILMNLTHPMVIVKEIVRKGIIYYKIKQYDGKIIKLKDHDALKLMPRQLLEFYETVYCWGEMYKSTLAELMENVKNIQNVVLRKNRANLQIQHIRGGFRTTDGFFFAVKWRNIFEYDYVADSYIKEKHLESLLIFYQGLSMSGEYVETAMAKIKN